MTAVFEQQRADANPFAQELYRLRTNHGWSLTELRDRSGVDIASLSLMERGLTVPMTHNARRLDDTLVAGGNLTTLAAQHRRTSIPPGIQRLLDDPTLMLQLSPRRRRAVRLRYVDGLTGKQAAALMGVTVSSVRSALKEAASWAEEGARLVSQGARRRQTEAQTVPSMIRKELVKGCAYGVVDIDGESGRTLVVAWLAEDGWRVGVDQGRIVADRLTKTKALNLMTRAAVDQMNRSVARTLLAEAAA